MGCPPVASVRSQLAMRYCVSATLGFSMHWNRSAGAPWRLIASRITRTISKVVRFERGCGEKITASRHLSA